VGLLEFAVLVLQIILRMSKISNSNFASKTHWYHFESVVFMLGSVKWSDDALNQATTAFIHIILIHRSQIPLNATGRPKLNKQISESSCLYRASVTIKTLYYQSDAQIYNS